MRQMDGLAKLHNNSPTCTVCKRFWQITTNIQLNLNAEPLCRAQACWHRWKTISSVELTNRSKQSTNQTFKQSHKQETQAKQNKTQQSQGTNTNNQTHTQTHTNKQSPKPGVIADSKTIKTSKLVCLQIQSKQDIMDLVMCWASVFLLQIQAIDAVIQGFPQMIVNRLTMCATHNIVDDKQSWIFTQQTDSRAGIQSTKIVDGCIIKTGVVCFLTITISSVSC